MKTTDEHVEERELLQAERDGLDSRRGLKIFDYCEQQYRYFCGECNLKEPVEVKKEQDFVCDCCGWRTVEFREVGL